MTSDDNLKDYRDLWGLNNRQGGDPSGSDDGPAFFNIKDLDDDDEVKKWLEVKIPALKTKATDFTRKSVENVMFSKGSLLDPNREYSNFDDANRFFRQAEVSFNIVYEFIELWVNRLGTFKAEISVLPATDDADARDNAKAKELALKDFFEKNKVNQLFNNFDRHCFTLGEAYIHASWDQDKGPLRPGFAAIESKFKSLKRVATGSGDEVNINRFPRIGDVKLELIPAIYVLFEDRPWTDLDYIILCLPTNADKLRSDYPDADISGSGDIPCYWMYHLPTAYLQKGRFVKYAAGEVLVNEDYLEPRFPVVRMTNIDVVGASRGKSFIEYIKSHQILINQTITEVWNNLRRTNKGKWVSQAKTVNPAHLHPRSPGLEYTGIKEPKYVVFPGIKREALDFIALLREYAEKQARIQGIVQGTPPPNVRSGLQFAQLEEMEKKSVEITVGKKYSAIEELGEIVAMLMARYYREEDGRQITIYGKDKEYLIKALQVGAIQGPHPVKVQSDSLPTGKTSQMSFYADLRKQFGPNVVPDELMIDMLDSGRFNQYTEFGGATVETTLAQISQMVAGKEPEPPGEYEDLILKWKIVVGTMRKRSFLTYKENVKKLFEDMVYAIEDMLINKQNKTPAMEQAIQQLPFFPVYYKPPTKQLTPPLPPAGPLPGPKGPALPPAPQGLAPTEGAPSEGDLLGQPQA